MWPFELHRASAKALLKDATIGCFFNKLMLSTCSPRYAGVSAFPRNPGQLGGEAKCI